MTRRRTSACRSRVPTSRITTDTDPRLTWTYRDVDHSADPAGAVGWMDTFGAWPSVVAYKARTIELVGGARPAIDVGCGVGDDVRAMGHGAIGIDSSARML